LPVWLQVPTVLMFTHGSERGFCYEQVVSSRNVYQSFDLQVKNHEAYHATIKSSRLVKLLQAFEESANWLVLIGTASGDRVSLNFWHIFSFCALRGVVSNQIKLQAILTGEKLNG